MKTILTLAIMLTFLSTNAYSQQLTRIAKCNLELSADSEDRFNAREVSIFVDVVSKPRNAFILLDGGLSSDIEGNIYKLKKFSYNKNEPTKFVGATSFTIHDGGGDSFIQYIFDIDMNGTDKADTFTYKVEEFNHVGDYDVLSKRSAEIYNCTYK